MSPTLWAVTPTPGMPLVAPALPLAVSVGEWLTMWSGILAAVLVAATTAAVTPSILRRLPVPLDAPPDLYTGNATARTRRLVFAASALGGVVVAWRVAPQGWAPWVALGSAGVLSVVIDAATTYLPKLLAWWGWLLAAVGVVLAALIAGDPRVLGRAAIAATCAAGLFAAVWWLGRGRLGFGDVRLMGLIGAVTGSSSLHLALGAVVAGTVVSAAWGVVVAAGRGRDGPFPYGPGLVAGAYLALALLGPG